MIRLVSIHVPKTAGRSFRAVLRGVYGEKKVFNITRDSGKMWNEELERSIPSSVEVLHGHFTFADISKLHRETGVPVITWLRDPVERVLSNYYFFIQRVGSGERPHAYHRRNEALMDYIRLGSSRDRMSRFLDGAVLKDLFFVGIMEHFDEDLRQLGARLGWGKVEPVHVNSNKAFRAQFPPVGGEVRKIIRDLNERDQALYEEGLRLRRLRSDSRNEINV